MTAQPTGRWYHFWQVDSFSSERYRGNPAAVVFEADDLEPEQMQTLARQFNLSETVFLLRPRDAGADYRARIFTPRSEIPFAGHPTIAVAFAFCEAGNTVERDIVRQECGIGTIRIDVTGDDERLFTISMGETSAAKTSITRAAMARMLGCRDADVADEPVEVCSAGLPWIAARVASLDALEAARPDLNLIERASTECDAVGLTVYSLGARTPSCELHVRSFAPLAGIREDPACGSGNGSVAVHLARHAYRDRQSFSYRAEQGLEVERRAILHLAADRVRGAELPRVRLGGHAVKVMQGQVLV